MNARETVHTHGCLNCRPDMVPDFTRDDPRYHDGEKCQYTCYALINGASPGYTTGIFEGPDGWALVCWPGGYSSADIHVCGTCYDSETGQGFEKAGVCVALRRGNVEVRHHCPARYTEASERAPFPPSFTNTMARNESTACLHWRAR